MEHHTQSAALSQLLLLNSHGPQLITQHPQISLHHSTLLSASHLLHISQRSAQALLHHLLLCTAQPKRLHLHP